jgi:hypothetical protein
MLVLSGILGSIVLHQQLILGQQQEANRQLTLQSAHQQRRIKRFTVALRDANVHGCQRQNRVRLAIRDLAQSANEGLRSITPNIAPNAASREVIAHRQEIRQHTRPAPCELLYPPVTGIRNHPIGIEKP